MTQYPIKNIVIVGSGLRAWLPAAYLAARFTERSCDITVVSAGEQEDAGEVAARPAIRHLHQVLQLTEWELASQAKASPLLRTIVKAHDGAPVHLPFGAYGLDRGGVEFFQYWQRASLAGNVPALGKFNLALQMAAAGMFMPKPPAGFPAFDYGYSFSRAAYGDLLKRYARRAGVAEAGEFDKASLSADGGRVLSVQASGTEICCDMVLDVTRTGQVSGMVGNESIGWVGNCLAVPAGSHLPGLELTVLQSGMERFIALLPGADFHPSETAEYNRLTRAEHDRIRDMEILLAGEEKTEALERKLNVFAARGRIPLEDYEVFTKPEWLAALLAQGVKPARYDRLADRTNIEDVTVWLSKLEQGIDHLIQALIRKGAA